MSTLTITRGLPAAGKTTWARQWVAEDPDRRARVNRDDLRAMLFVNPTYHHDQEVRVTAVARQLVRDLLAAGRDVIADDTNLRVRYVREWARFASAHGATLTVVDFPVDVDEAVARDAARPRPVGEDVIRRMASRFLQSGHLPVLPDPLYHEGGGDRFDLEQPYVPKPGAPRAIIVDIDGTVALMNGRSPYDTTRYADDLPNAAVIDAVRTADESGYLVIYCSGRDETGRGDTLTWLRKHVGVPGELFMRAAGDRRRDSVVKLDLFNDHIRDHYDVRWVLDDRQQVVDMWRALGLTVFQVAPGDF